MKTKNLGLLRVSNLPQSRVKKLISKPDRSSPKRNKPQADRPMFESPVRDQVQTKRPGMPNFASMSNFRRNLKKQDQLKTGVNEITQMMQDVAIKSIVDSDYLSDSGMSDRGFSSDSEQPMGELSGDPFQKLPGQRKYQCTLCEQFFTESYRRKHIQVSHKNYTYIPKKNGRPVQQVVSAQYFGQKLAKWRPLIPGAPFVRARKSYDPRGDVTTHVHFVECDFSLNPRMKEVISLCDARFNLPRDDKLRLHSLPEVEETSGEEVDLARAAMGLWLEKAVGKHVVRPRSASHERKLRVNENFHVMDNIPQHENYHPESD